MITDQEIRLRCLELAIQKTPPASSHDQWLEAVAKSQTWFYNRIVQDDPVPESDLPPARKPGRPRKSDKSAELLS